MTDVYKHISSISKKTTCFDDVNDVYIYDMSEALDYISNYKYIQNLMCENIVKLFIVRPVLDEGKCFRLVHILLSFYSSKNCLLDM